MPTQGTRDIPNLYLPNILKCNLFPRALGRTKKTVFLKSFLLKQKNKAQWLIFIISQKKPPPPQHTHTCDVILIHTQEKQSLVN